MLATRRLPAISRSTIADVLQAEAGDVARIVDLRVMKAEAGHDAAPQAGEVAKASRATRCRIVKPGRVTIAGKPSADLPPGTERSILRQAGLTRRST